MGTQVGRTGRRASPWMPLPPRRCHRGQHLSRSSDPRSFLEKEAGPCRGGLAQPALPRCDPPLALAAAPMPGIMRNRSLTRLSTAVVMILTRGNA